MSQTSKLWEQTYGIFFRSSPLLESSNHMLIRRKIKRASNITALYKLTSCKAPDSFSGEVVVSPVATKAEYLEQSKYFFTCCAMYCGLLPLVLWYINAYFLVGFLHNFTDDFIHTEQRKTLLWGVGLGGLLGGARW